MPADCAPGRDHEQREAPQALAHEARARSAGDLAVALGHPGAARIGLEQPAQAHARRPARAGVRRGAPCAR